MNRTSRNTTVREGTAILMMKCKTCGSEFRTFPSAVKKGRKYCSRRCQPNESLNRHGMSYTRIHRIWCGMKRRTRKDCQFAAEYYSGRGIGLCVEWEQFLPFMRWAMANGYQDDLEIDRIDNNKGYSPDNCRWATRAQQMSNTRKRRDAKTSRFKGVSWCANVGKWRAQIQHSGNHRNLGLFANEEDAARAYDQEARRVFGEFASPNFKEEGAPS